MANNGHPAECARARQRLTQPIALIRENKMRILAVATKAHIALMFRDETWKQLTSEHQVEQNEFDRAMTPAEVCERIGDAEVAITGWVNPPFTPEILNAAGSLRLVAHAAGSLKSLFGDPASRQILNERGIVVCSGAACLGANVAEATIGLMIAMSRRWFEHRDRFASARKMGTGVPGNGQYLLGATVGMVSASTITRLTIPLLRPFGCRILVYDPFLTADQAAALGVELTDLDSLFARSDIVSLHTPALPATRHLIGASQLRLMRDGATLINTARGMVLDHEALAAECRNGRITAALDVTDPEPLPADSPLWDMPNVVILPHIAGAGYAGYFGIGDTILGAVSDLAEGRPIRAAVSLERWEQLA
jgi:phosphoglycerate dehydrogenase-like enzyme